MRIQPVVASVVGMVDENHWGQVLVLPHAYGVVEVKRAATDALTFGTQLLSHLTQRLSRPISTLVEIEALVKEMEKEDMVSLLLLVPVGNVIYVVISGTGAAYLKRGGQLSLLISETGSISGEIQEGDTILLATKTCVENAPKEKLSLLFDHLKPGEVAEKLTILLHGQPDTAGSASLIFQVEKLIAIEEEPVSFVAQPVIPTPRRHAFSKIRSFRPHHLSRIKPSFGRPQKLTKRAILVTVVTLFFGASVLFGLVKQAGNTQNQAAVAATLEAQQAYDEGMALLSLNTIKSRERLGQAKTILEPFLKTTSPKSKEGRALGSLYQQINDAIIQLQAVTKGEPQLFYDVSLLKKGATASVIALAADTLAVGDREGKTVYTVGIRAKNGQVIAGGESFTGISSIGIHGDTVYVLTDTGIFAVRTIGKTKEEVVKKDDAWGTITTIWAFAGNLYLLDSAKSRIWKYIATEEGFTERREYLNPDTLPDFSKTINLAINGSVWLGTSEGKIFRFTQGKEATFVPQGVEPAFGQRLLVYTNDKDTNVYVLDSEKKRVVVLDKEGMYLSQYVWEGAIAPTQMVVSETDKKILLLVEGKIYSIELK